MTTKKEAQLLSFLETWEAKYDFGPSYEDLMKAMGLKSKCGVHRLIIQLEKKGKLDRQQYRARTVKIKKQPSKREILQEIISKLNRPDCETARNIVSQMLVNEQLRQGI